MQEIKEIALTSNCLKATLCSGSHAVYELQSQHLDRQHFDVPVGPKATRLPSMNSVAIMYGRLLAVKNGETWFDQRQGRAAWSVRITDRGTLAALEACPLADTKESP